MNRRLFGTFAICSVVMALSSQAYATFSSGTINDITIDSGANYARISVGTTAVTGRPACHNNAAYSTHWSIDLSTAKGKALMTAATSAMLAGKQVNITGAGTCFTVSSGLTIESIGVMSVFP